MAQIVQTPIPPGARSRIQSSTRLLSEWLALYHTGDLVWYQLRLGPTAQTTPGVQLDPALERMMRRRNLYADAVVVTPTAIEVVEAKVVATPSALSQVRTYAGLVGATPELKPYGHRPIIPIVVFATDDPIVRQEAAALGVRVVVYTPTWIGEYLASRYYLLGRSA
jgi:hypothetical protein